MFSPLKKFMNFLIFGVIFFGLGLVLPVISNEIGGVPEAAAFRISSSDLIRLDGLLDESFWEKALPIGPLHMVEPDEDVEQKEGISASVSTDRHSGNRAVPHYLHRCTSILIKHKKACKNILLSLRQPSGVPVGHSGAEEGDVLHNCKRRRLESTLIDILLGI